MPCAAPLPHLGGPAGAGEQRQRRLVDRHRQHPGVVVERGLHAVAVVRVDVDVGDLVDARVEQRLDAQRDVVVDAEAGGVVGHRVVQAAAEIDRPVDLAAGDRLRRVDRPTGDQRGVVVHAGEDRVVRGAEAVPDRTRKVLRRLPHRLDVVRGVDPGQHLVVGRLRLQHLVVLEHAEFAGQRPGQFPAQRVQRMIAAQVVAQHARVPDHQRPVIRRTRRITHD